MFRRNSLPRSLSSTNKQIRTLDEGWRFQIHGRKQSYQDFIDIHLHFRDIYISISETYISPFQTYISPFQRHIYPFQRHISPFQRHISISETYLNSETHIYFRDTYIPISVIYISISEAYIYLHFRTRNGITGSSETLLPFYQAVWCQNPLQSPNGETKISYKFVGLQHPVTKPVTQGLLL